MSLARGFSGTGGLVLLRVVGRGLPGETQTRMKTMGILMESIGTLAVAQQGVGRRRICTQLGRKTKLASIHQHGGG